MNPKIVLLIIQAPFLCYNPDLLLDIKRSRHSAPALQERLSVSMASPTQLHQGLKSLGSSLKALGFKVRFESAMDPKA